MSTRRTTPRPPPWPGDAPSASSGASCPAWYPSPPPTPRPIRPRWPARRANPSRGHVDADDPARARLHLGPLLPASLRDLLVCDATARVVLERKGTPVHVLARRRTVDDRLRSLVEQRDGGCRVPGCGRRRWLHVHHLVHHDHGGPTLPANLCCLCPAHHRLHHAGRLGMAGDPTTPDGLVFTDRRGRPIGGPSPRPPGAPPAQAAAAFGLPAPRWDPPLGEPLDERWITWS